jgi:hypothetical protein
MKRWKFALIGSVVLLLGAAATRGATSGPPAAASAMIVGSVACSEFGGRVGLSFDLGGTGPGPEGPGERVPARGGVVGVPGLPLGFFHPVSGTCDDAVAALGAELPAPLCAAGRLGRFGLQFACSGLARDVVEAVGDLAKALVALP